MKTNTLYFKFLVFIYCVILQPASARAGEVQIPPLQSSYTSSGYWQVKVNGLSVPVAKFDPQGGINYYFAHLSASGSNVFEVEAFQAITDYAIRPSSYGMVGTVNSTKLSFTLDQPRYLEIKINLRTLLYILVDPIEVGVPSPSGTGIFNITAPPYNADNTGSIEVTSIIQQAINAAAARSGGGIVYVPMGTYQTGTLALKSNVDIYLQGGAVLLATLNKSSYSGTNPKHVIRADNVSNVKVRGRGSINCRGVKLNNFQNTAADGTFRIAPIQFANTHGATIEGITLIESSGWTLTFTLGSSDIDVKNIKIINEMQWGWNDGINVIGSHDVDVRHCFISTADDAACVKTQNFPKANPGDAAYNIVYDDLVLRSGISSGFKVGMQAEDDIYNVRVVNVNVLDCERAFNIDHWYGDGYWHDIHFVDWVVDKMTGTSQSLKKGAYIDCPFRIEIARQPSTSYEEGVGNISDIEITRVKFKEIAPNNAYFWGENADNRITHVSITDVYFGENLILSNSDGPIQNKGFASNISYNDGPRIDFGFPLAGSEISERMTVTVDAENPNAVTRVDLYLNNAFVSSDFSPPFSWNEEGQEPLLENIAAGPHSLKAIAFNAQGATTEITNQILMPVIKFKSLTPGKILSEGDGLTVIVSPVGQGISISKIDLFWDDAYIRTESVSPYAWNEENQPSDAALRDLEIGSHTLRAVATLGTGVTSSISTTITVADPNVPPTFAAFYDAWVGAHPSIGLLDGIHDDPDDDGLVNGIEAWFGTPPDQFSNGFIAGSLVGASFTAVHPVNPDIPASLYGYYEWSPDLMDWYRGDGLSGPGGGLTAVITSDIQNGIAVITANGSRTFDHFFLRASLPPQ